MLTSAKVGDAIVHLTQQFALPPLILGWLIAMLLSVSTGSATVGIVGAAGLLAPLAGADPSLNLPLLALSIGCGSLFFNYANHAGFWMVKESFGMTMGEATKTISVVQSIVAVVGLVMVLLFKRGPPGWRQRSAIARACHGTWPGPADPSRFVIPPSPPRCTGGRCSLQWRSTLGCPVFPRSGSRPAQDFPHVEPLQARPGSPS
jgi:hypothetical protein